uniref:Fibroblast activation protein, alpha n=1 Tax=Salmo trutta TaxID=8032 RepID=A0A674F667_SALTR
CLIINKPIFAVVDSSKMHLSLIQVHFHVSGEDAGSNRPFTLADYFNDTIRYKIYNLRWISDNEYLHKTRQGNIMLHNAETGDFFEYISNNTFEQVYATDYIISADRKYICFESNYSKQWRHSFTASYSIYDYDSSLNYSSITKDLMFLSLSPRTFLKSVNIPQVVQYFAWAPTGNKLAYVWNYNIYLKPNATAEAIQVTHNGKENQILNGAPDWVYEEEVFSSNEAIWWSPTGKYLAYAEFNDTGVHTIEYSLYGNGQYPSTVVVPYPKAGSTNPKAKLFVVDTINPSRRTQVVVPDSIGAGDHYLSSVTWVTDERIAVQWTKRKQNHVLLQIYDFDGNNWNENQVLVTSPQTLWYVPLQPMFAEDHISFYKVMSDTYGYKHLHLHIIQKGKATPITSGKWEVIYISKLTKDAIYYVSNEYQGKPGQRNLYKVMIGRSHSAPQCLTCGLYKDRCQYNSAYFSYNASYYRMDCYGSCFVLELLVLRDNKDLEEMLKEFQMPTMQRGTLRPSCDCVKLYAYFPYRYGGPCSQKADYRYRLNWGSYLSSTEGIIVASFDGRGSGYQGDKIMHSIYQRLGTFEVEDQITATRKFIDMGFIDKERIAIWGWSYGGYVTSMALGAGSGVFKCGIAVAPVSSHNLLYCMSTVTVSTYKQLSIQQNSTVTSRAKNFKSVEYLLVHGTADDNVHFQQSAQISKALVVQQVDFEAMWYTDRDHGLGGPAYHHLYTHMSQFLQKCLVKPKSI